MPTITERQWYPVWNKYREAVYPAPQPDGITDWGIQPCLFDEIKIYVCASAEFFKTWLGASWQADSFKSMLAESTHVEMCEYQGEAAFCLTRPCHEKQEANRYRSRVDTFWITQDKQRLLGWRSEGVDIRYGEFVGYLVVDRHYNYRDCNAEIHVSEGNGFPAQW